MPVTVLFDFLQIRLAKNHVTAILDRFGWETEDMGSVESARAIEPLAMLGVFPDY